MEEGVLELEVVIRFIGNDCLCRCRNQDFLHPAGLISTHPINSFSKQSYKIQVFSSSSPMKTHIFDFLFFGFTHSGYNSFYFENLPLK